jgi:hypothetical protein
VESVYHEGGMIAGGIILALLLFGIYTIHKSIDSYYAAERAIWNAKVEYTLYLASIQKRKDDNG